MFPNFIIKDNCIVVPQKKVQVKSHKKKRINKKWKKRYGDKMVERLPDYTIYRLSGKLFMNANTYNEIEKMGIENFQQQFNDKFTGVL